MSKRKFLLASFVFVIIATFLLKNLLETSKPIDIQSHKEELQIEEKQKTDKSSIVVDAVTNKNLDYIIDNSQTYNFGCKQKMMNTVPGDSLEECKNQETFTAYTIGVIESSGTVLSKEQYTKFLEEFFNNDSFEFIKKYSKEDFLYLLENGDNLGFINSEKNKFLLVMIDENGKIEIAYQDKKVLFEDYIY